MNDNIDNPGKDSEILLQTVFDTVVDGIIVINEKGNIETLNSAAEKIFGYQESEVKGKNVKVLMPEPFHSEHDEYLKNYKSTSKAKVIGIGREVIGRRKDGSTFPMELAVGEMELSGHKMFTGIVRDITERRQAELEIHEREARARSIVETVLDGIITTDAQGSIETFSAEAERIFGYPAAEVIGSTVKILMPESHQKKHDGYMRNYLDSGETRIIGIGRELVGCRKNGEEFPMELAISEMEIDGKRMFTGRIRDITERKLAEKMKNEFVSTVSHELRTPLTSIKGSLGLIQSGAVGELPEKLKKMLNIAHNNSDRLIRLINDILDIEKIEAGKMDFSMKILNLNELVDDALEANKDYGKKHNVGFLQTGKLESAAIRGDYDRLMQVFANLLSNAAKFSPEGENVEVLLREVDGYFRIEVSDHGDGIKDEFRDRIFSKFAQADSSDTRVKGGTGLGLSIAKKIVEKHSGSIGFDTEIGQGTTFHFSIPCYQKEGDKVVGADSGLQKQRILICEDDHDTATLLEMMLKQAGYEADIARTAEAAEEMLEQREYQAMTLDLLLPDKDGISMFKGIRQNPKFEDLPVVVVSAVAAEEKQKLSGNALGVIDWIEKPINYDHLARALRKSMLKFSSDAPRVLHIEDDQDILDVVQNLVGELADVSAARTIFESKRLLEKEVFDLVILDLTLPDGRGEELLPLLENIHGESIPVIVFSAADDAREKVGEIESILVKSRTSNEQLLESIRSIVSNKK